MNTEIVLIVIGFFVAIISATFGFGGAIILIPIVALLLPIKKAIVIIAFFFLAVNINKAIFNWKHINWKISLLIMAGAIPFAFGGSLLMNLVCSAVLTRILGAIIILYLLNEILNKSKKIKMNNLLIVISSSVYGFFSGIIGTGDVIKAALLSQIGMTKEKFIATMGITAIFINLAKITTYSKFNIVDKNDTLLIGGMMISSVLGALIGRNFVKKISDKVFKVVIFSLLAIVGIKMLIF